MNEGSEARSAPDVRADGHILVPGQSCWRRVRAGRLAVLVDGEAYFSVLADALETAERSILITGWDIHSGLRLRRDGAGDPTPGLRQLLVDLVGRKRRLHVHVLLWDFALLFALEREMFPVFKLGWQTPRRIHFHLDDHHPLGASHHQKIVVIDDSIAFAGGIDLSTARWDTRTHRAVEPRRDDNETSRPFHDLQVAVDGEAAAALGDLVRERWRQATGHRLRPGHAGGNRWPTRLEPDLRDVDVAIARTLPACDDQPEVREIERLHLDAIAAARHTIYLENQYLTSGVIADALGRRLREPDGPEVVYVGPRACSGWLEEATMGHLRARLLRRLEQDDRHGRLRTYCVVAAGDPAVGVNIHAKLMIVDDRLARIGSANLSNRSMGLDTECDLAVEAAGNPEVARAIAHLRDDLLAEHLDVTPDVVGEAVARSGSLGEAVERLRARGGRLEPLGVPDETMLDGFVPDDAFIDFERPFASDELLRRFLAEEPITTRRRIWLRLAVGLAVVIALAVAWRVGPLADWLQPERLAAAGRTLAESPWGPPLAAVLFVPAGFLMAPVMGLIVAAGLVFGPWVGFAVGLSGALMSAFACYAAGRWLWRDAVRRLGGQRLNRVSRKLAKRGILAMAAVRMVPVAPFTVVNLAAGASHIGLRDFTLGTVLGMAPGALALTVLAGRLRAAWENPGPGTVAALGGAVLVVVVGLVLLRRSLGGRAT